VTSDELRVPGITAVWKEIEEFFPTNPVEIWDHVGKVPIHRHSDKNEKKTVFLGRFPWQSILLRTQSVKWILGYIFVLGSTPLSMTLQTALTRKKNYFWITKCFGKHGSASGWFAAITKFVEEFRIVVRASAVKAAYGMRDLEFLSSLASEIMFLKDVAAVEIAVNLEEKIIIIDGSRKVL
jgi:hypothetical protein